MRKRIKIGAVSYLNTKPLVFGLSQRLPDADLVYDLPSRLADRLSSGDLDVALIPSLEYFQDRSYRIVSDACIACRGPVMSVRMLSRVPASKIRSLALDEGSRTSAGLIQVLLWRRFQLRPQLVPFPIGSTVPPGDVDAILIIGDRAMHVDAGQHGQYQHGQYVENWDLGDEWCRWAELPFVFAMWVARRGVDTVDIETALAESRDDGLRNLEEIVRVEARRANLTQEMCLIYFRDHLHFFLGESERAGLTAFHRYLVELGLAPSDWKIEAQLNGCQAT